MQLCSQRCTGMQPSAHPLPPISCVADFATLARTFERTCSNVTVVRDMSAVLQPRWPFCPQETTHPTWFQSSLLVALKAQPATSFLTTSPGFESTAESCTITTLLSGRIYRCVLAHILQDSTILIAHTASHSLRL